MNRSGIVLALAAGAVALSSLVAAAGPRDRYARIGDYVVAESRFGHGSVSGPVRPTSLGVYQVRLPGGTWIDCRRSCSETLRVETVDFWENQGRNRIDNEGGILGPLTIHRYF